MSRLSKARLHLDSARLAHSRLSTAEETNAILLPMTFGAADLELGVNGLPAAVADWSQLEEDLGRRATLSLAAAPIEPAPVLLWPAAYAKPYFDERSQEAIWPVCDGNGRWVALSVPATEEGAHRLEAIEYHLRMLVPHIVLATAEPKGDAWRLSPYAVLHEAQQATVPVQADQTQLKLVNLDFDDLKKSTQSRWWWEHINKPGPEHGFDTASRFKRAVSPSVTRQLLHKALDCVSTAAQLGCAVVDEDTAKVAAQLAGRLDGAGLTIVSQQLAGLGRLGPVAPERVLSLVYMIDKLNSVRRRLPLLIETGT